MDAIADNLLCLVAAHVASKECSTSAPKDRYWELLRKTTRVRPWADGAIERTYQAQRAKDDAMADSVAGNVATHPHRQPLVIHCKGNFHSDYGPGTAARMAWRVPLARAAVVSMVAVPDVTKADVAGSLK